MGTTLIQPATEVADVEESDNPFVGLRAYEAEESYLFFGRGRQTTELLEKLNATRFIGVVGSSGCGKSSLIKAGLIPKLKAGFLTGERDQWMIASMRPSGNPLLFLAQSLNEAIDASSFITSEQRRFADYTPEIIATIKEKGPQGMLDLLLPLFENSRTNLLLLVDQFEELFTTKRSHASEETLKNENINFVNILLSLARQKNLPIYVIITMRSDYIGNCNKFYGLPEVLNDGQYLVPRLNRQQLQEIIELPIKSYGQKISPRLLDQLLNDSDKDLDQLPVLQHSLMRTYKFWLDKPSANVIEFEHYEAAGKLENALSNHANEIYDKLNTTQKKIAEIVFRSLTDVNADNDPIRRRQSLGQLIEVAKSIQNVSANDVVEVIDRFRGIDCAFLTPFRGKIKESTIIDISHESLMRQWDKLKEWMHEEQGSARKFKWLSESVTNKREVLRGIDLKDALGWKRKQQPNEAWAGRYGNNLTEVEEYLEKSKKRGKVYKAFAYSGALIFLAFLIIITFQQKSIAAKERATVKAEFKRKEQEIKAAKESLAFHEQKDRLEEASKAEKAKLQMQMLSEKNAAAIKKAQDQLAFYKLQQQQLNTIATAKLINEQKEGFEQQLVIQDLQNQVFYLSNLIDNEIKKTIIDSLLKIPRHEQFAIDTAKHLKTDLLNAVNNSVTASSQFSEDPKEGLRMARDVWKANKSPLINTILLKNINRSLFYKQVITPSRENYISNPFIVFTHDKSTFAIADGNGRLFKGNYKNGNLSIDENFKYSYTNAYTTDSSVTSYNSINNFSINNNDVVGVQTDGRIIKWSGSTKKELGTLDNNEFKQIQFSPDNKFLVTAPNNKSTSNEINDRSVKLWKLEGDSLAEPLVLDSSIQVKQITFAPAANQFFLLYTDGKFKAWKTNEKKSFFDTTRIYSANYSPVADNIIVTSVSGDVKVINYSGKETFPRTRFLINSSPFRPNAFSISSDWKKMICKISDKFFILKKADGDSVIKKNPALLTRLIPRDFTENLDLINATFLDSNEIFTLTSAGKINVWNTYPQFRSLDTALSTIEIPALTVVEKLREKITSFDDLMNSRNESELRDALEYYERAPSRGHGYDNDKYKQNINYTKQLYKRLLEIADENHKYYYLDKLVSFNNQNGVGEGKNSELIALLKENIDYFESLHTTNRLVIADLSRTYGKLADEQYVNKEYGEAIKSLEKAVALYPANNFLYANLAKNYLLSNQLKEALNIYQAYKGKMFADSSNSFTAAFLQDFTDMESAGLITTVEPGLSSKVADIRVMLFDDRIRHNEVLRQKQKGNEVDSSLLDQLAADYSEKSYYLLLTRNYEEAIKSANASLDLHTGADIAYTNLALGYLLTGQFDKATKIYTDYKDKQISRDERSFKAGFLKDFEDMESAGIISKKDQKLYEKVSQIKAMLEK